MTTYYLTNDEITAVTGTADKKGVSLTRAVRADVRGCVSNGLITDPERFSELLRQFMADNKLPRGEAALVADSSLMVSKRLELPRSKPARMLEFIRMEFAHIERISDPVYSYSVQGREKDGMVSVLAEMTERSLVRDLQESFARVGVKLRGVDSPIASAVRFLSRHQEVAAAGACSVLVYGGGALTSLAFTDGVFAFSGRRKLTGDPAGEDFALELLRGLEYDSRVFGNEAGDARLRLCGFDDEAALTACVESLARLRPDMDVRPLALDEQLRMVSQMKKDEVWPGRFLFALGGLFPVKAEENFLARAAADEQQQARRRKSGLRAAIPLVVLALLAGAVLTLGLRERGALAALEQLNAQLKDPALVQAAQDYEDAARETERLLLTAEECQAVATAIETYPTVNSRLDKLVDACADGLVYTELNGFTRRDGSIRLDVVAENVDDINVFINLLRQEDVFTDIDYTGYVRVEEGEWTTSVLCQLSEGAMRG